MNITAFQHFAPIAEFYACGGTPNGTDGLIYIDYKTSVDFSAAVFCPIPTGTGELGLDDDGDGINNLFDPDFTPVGANVTVTLDGNTVTFSSVVSSGTTTITSAAPNVPPIKYKLLGARYVYEIITTATYNGSVTIALPYNESDVKGLERNVRVLRYNETTGVWDDVTDYADTINNVVYAFVDHLSLYAIAEVPTLDGLLLIKNRLYETGEIDHEGIMMSLNKKLEVVEAKIDTGQNAVAKNLLKSFISEMESQRGRHVSEFAADELKTYAELLIEWL